MDRGPLEWHANAGLDWTRGRFTLGFNGQFYSRYKVTFATPARYDDAYYIKQQGSAHIPPQVYFDLSGAYRFGASGRRPDERGPELRWGLMNVFDHRPATVVDSYDAGYSYYGDPRRRRIQLTVDLPFGGR
jgi:iron complex outermembrane receptor protein